MAPIKPKTAAAGSVKRKPSVSDAESPSLNPKTLVTPPINIRTRGAGKVASKREMATSPASAMRLLEAALVAHPNTSGEVKCAAVACVQFLGDALEELAVNRREQEGNPSPQLLDSMAETLRELAQSAAAQNDRIQAVAATLQDIREAAERRESEVDTRYQRTKDAINNLSLNHHKAVENLASAVRDIETNGMNTSLPLADVGAISGLQVALKETAETIAMARHTPEGVRKVLGAVEALTARMDNIQEALSQASQSAGEVREEISPLLRAPQATISISTTPTPPPPPPPSSSPPPLNSKVAESGTEKCPPPPPPTQHPGAPALASTSTSLKTSQSKSAPLPAARTAQEKQKTQRKNPANPETQASGKKLSRAARRTAARRERRKKKRNEDHAATLGVSPTEGRDIAGTSAEAPKRSKVSRKNAAGSVSPTKETHNGPATQLRKQQRPLPTPKPTSKGRGEALVVRVENRPYAEAVKALTSRVDPGELRTTIESVRMSRGGDIIVSLTGSARAAPLLKKIQAGGFQARSLTPNTSVTISKIDAGTTKEGIAEALRERLGPEEEITVKSLRNSIGGTQRAVVQLGAEAAVIVASEEKIRIGWANCRVTPLENKPPACYKCWSDGHQARECGHPDRSRDCLNCGETGHKAAECPRSKPFCKRCGQEGHREWGSRCQRAGTAENNIRPTIPVSSTIPVQKRKNPAPHTGLGYGAATTTSSSLATQLTPAAVANDRQAIAVAKAGALGNGEPVTINTEEAKGGPRSAVDITTSPVARITKAAVATMQRDEYAHRYVVSRLAEESVRDAVRLYLAYSHDKGEDTCFRDNSPQNLRQRIRNAGLPVDLDQLMSIYVASYVSKGETAESAREDLKGFRRLCDTERQQQTQRAREVNAAYHSPVNQKNPGSAWKKTF